MTNTEAIREVATEALLSMRYARLHGERFAFASIYRGGAWVKGAADQWGFKVDADDLDSDRIDETYSELVEWMAA